MADETAGGRELGLSTFGNNYGRGGFIGDGYVCCLPSEHCHKVHRNHTHYGYVSGIVAAPWGAGVTSVVRKGELGTGGGGRIRQGRRERRGWRRRRMDKNKTTKM